MSHQITVRLRLSRHAGLITVAAFMLACWSSRLGAQHIAPADMVLLNGRVATLDTKAPVAQAVAVRGDRIVAVGSDADVRRHVGPRTRVIDLRGRGVVPGLADGHLHDAGGGAGVDLSQARSLGDVLDAIATAVQRTPPGEVIFTNSDWHEAQLREQRLPLRQDLDRVAPQHPVVVVRGGHELILNSAALAKWKITKETPVPPGGQISRDASGELNGELVDAAMRLVQRPPPPPLTADRLASQFRKLNAAGLTSIRIPGGSAEMYRVLREMHARNALTLRVDFLFRLTDARDSARVRAQVSSWGATPTDGDAWLRVGGVKLGVDGGFEGGWMREPYAEPMGAGGRYVGLQTMPEAQFRTAVFTLHSLGWRVATHAVGDAAIDLVLRVYASADSQRTIRDRRWAIEHAFIARPEHVRLMRELGVIASVQNHLYLAGPSLVKYWGAERAALTTPMRRFIDAGVVVAAGTDSPVVPHPPLKTFYHFVTRNTISGGILGPDQRITPTEALRAATWGNAYLSWQEDARGIIAPGQLADLVVLSDDLLTATSDALDRVRVEMTVVGGRVVFSRDQR